MSKAVLVIDEMPGCCGDCPCFNAVYIGCHIIYEKIGIDTAYFGSRPCFCPLKEIPERKPDLGIDIIHPESLEVEYYNDGWNACIDELEKE